MLASVVVTVTWDVVSIGADLRPPAAVPVSAGSESRARGHAVS